MATQNIALEVEKRANEISPLLYGIFFEDINYAGDGGLYAELIANRSFAYYDKDEQEDWHALGWKTTKGATLTVAKSQGAGNFGAYIGTLLGQAQSALYNEGFCQEGLYAKEGEEYLLTCFARSKKPVHLCAKLCRTLNEEGTLSAEDIGKTEFVVNSEDWQKLELSIRCKESESHAVFSLWLQEDAEVEFAYISLFPSDTFMGRKNGMRRDLGEKLKALSPKFMRFPGGCIVEGRSFLNMYNWKETMGEPWERRTNWNRWQMEEYQQEGRHSKDYFQSYGIGFFEYFQLCEDIGATPVPVINCGMTCQWHEGLLTPMDELMPFIQDALDLVEFANGAETTKWGGLRAKMGHKEPFGLEFIGIGNEQWGPDYFARYEAFEKVFSERCPQIKLITSAGWDSEGKDFDYAYSWMEKNKEKAYGVDEHFYKSPEWFLSNIHRYDTYDRTLPKVFAGEYAAHTSSEIPKRRNNFYAALCEAAFLTGVEKNADHVIMSCYAPLFAREGHQQWQPDLIWFDQKQSYGSPSYYVQKLFSEHTGRVSLAMDQAMLKELEQKSIYVAASYDEAKNCVYVKLVNLSNEKQSISVSLDEEASAHGYFIEGEPLDENSFEEPEKICIHQREVELSELELSKACVCVLEMCV